MKKRQASFETICSLFGTVMGIVMPFLSFSDVAKQGMHTQFILLFVSLLLIGISITLFISIHRIKNKQIQNMITAIDENLSRSNTLLPSTLKYVLRTSIQGQKEALNNVSVSNYDFTIEIGQIMPDGRASVRTKRRIRGKAKDKLQSIIIPFSHSIVNATDDYSFRIIDTMTKISLDYRIITIGNIECIDVTPKKLLKRKDYFDIIIIVEDKKVFSYNDSNQVHAFLADPSFCFDSWEVLTIKTLMKDQTIKDYNSMLCLVNRQSYMWESLETVPFTKGTINHVIKYSELESTQKSSVFVTLLTKPKN